MCTQHGNLATVIFILYRMFNTIANNMMLLCLKYDNAILLNTSKFDNTE